MLTMIECVESKYEVEPVAEFDFVQILHMLQYSQAQPLTDPLTAERGVYIPTPGKAPGVRKIAVMKPATRDRNRTVTYGCD